MENFISSEESMYRNAHPKSYDMLTTAKETMISGVSSCYQNINPFPIYFQDGSGCNITDVDNNNYVDLHCGFGVTIFGYKHPIILDALNVNLIQPQIVGYPSPIILSASQKLADIYKFPKWRFMNSGTEATLDAIRLSRAYLNRKYIIKIEGGYHGHHDSVWVGITPNISLDRLYIQSAPYCDGIPEEILQLTIVIESNNIPYLRTIVDKYKSDIAGIIIEPTLLNCGMISLNDDFLDEISIVCKQYDITLIYDLVKINSCSLPSDWNRVKPDIITLGKSVAAGYPIGVIGMTDKYAELVSSGRVALGGTLNGNLHTIHILNTVINYLTSDVIGECVAKSKHIETEFNAILEKYNISGYAKSYGIKGAVTFTYRQVSNYSDYYQHVNKELEYLWYLYATNRGFLIQIRDEWTISLPVTDNHVEQFIALFDAFCNRVCS